MLYIHVQGQLTEGRDGKRYGRLNAWLTGRPPNDLELVTVEARDLSPLRLFRARLNAFIFRVTVEPWLSGHVRILRPANESPSPEPMGRLLRADDFGADEPGQD